MVAIYSYKHSIGISNGMRWNISGVFLTIIIGFYMKSWFEVEVFTFFTNLLIISLNIGPRRRNPHILDCPFTLAGEYNPLVNTYGVITVFGVENSMSC